METKPMTTAEAEEVIKREFGDYARYRQSSYANAPTEAQALVKFWTDYILTLAKARGVSLETLFKERPDLYKEYRNSFR